MRIFVEGEIVKILASRKSRYALRVEAVIDLEQ